MIEKSTIFPLEQSLLLCAIKQTPYCSVPRHFTAHAAITRVYQAMAFR